MSARRLTWIGLTAASLALCVPGVGASREDASDTIADVVRDATRRYRNVNDAIADGYVQFQGCVSGPQEGAMGVHYVKPSLFDGAIEATTPEALVYEPKNGRLHLVAVEYIAPAEPWQAANPGVQPSVAGHLFHFVPGPNRYGAAAFYELHVWAWRENPNGTFADWNPHVSCDAFVSEGATAAASHGSGH